MDTLLSGLESLPSVLRRYYSLMRDLDKSLQGMLYGLENHCTLYKFCNDNKWSGSNMVSQIPLQCVLLNFEKFKTLKSNVFKTTDLSSLLFENFLAHFFYFLHYFLLEKWCFNSWISNVIPRSNVVFDV